MNITLKQLKSLKACPSGIDWFKSQKDREAKTVLRKLLKEDRFNYARWYVSRLFTHPQAVLFSIFCAERCIGIFESGNSTDKRPRQAIEAAKKWLIDPTMQNQDAAAYTAYAAANAAANAANAAAYTAYAAANAANAANAAAYAAANAANAAAYTAYAAANAATAAANAAAYAAANDDANDAEKTVIIERAIEILGL